MARLKVICEGKLMKDASFNKAKEYIAGRGENCDIVLNNRPGISRQHFKIFYHEGEWQLQVMSKFGAILFEDEKIEAMVLESGVNFSVPPYSFVFMDGADEHNLNPSLGSSENLPALSESGVPSYAMVPTRQDGSSGEAGEFISPSGTTDNFEEGAEEATFVGETQKGLPYIKFVDSEQNPQQVFRLEGNLWIAGRDTSCAILINDKRVSRNQFEIQKSSTGYYIKDLGSLNGTLLNAKAIPSDKPVSLKSGDMISVLDHILYFEIRDPEFNEKVKQLNPLVISSPPALESASSGESTPSYPPAVYSQDQAFNAPAPYNPMGFGAPPMYPTQYMPPLPGGMAPPPAASSQKKKKLIFYGLIAAVLLGAVGLSMMPENKPKVTKPVQVKPDDPLAKLTPDEINLLEHTLNLALNYYKKGSYEMALAEVQKIHEKVPIYKDSKTLEQKCLQAFEIRKEKDEIERMKREAEALAKQVNEVIERCSQKVDKIETLEEMNTCLADALVNDPQNDRIKQLQAAVTHKQDEKIRKEAEKQQYEERVRRGKALFEKAKAVEKAGKMLEAIEAYKHHTQHEFPDPANLKGQSKREISSLRAKVDEKIKNALDKSKQLYDEGNLKEAYIFLEQAKEIDPKNQAIVAKQIEIRNELSKKMKVTYQEGIIEESIGQIESAKVKWREILKVDLDDGEYARKAKIKLKKYGDIF